MGNVSINSPSSADASTLNGHPISSNGSAGIPVIPVNNGILEAGVGIDFHSDNGNSDFAMRLVYDENTKSMVLQHNGTAEPGILTANINGNALYLNGYADTQFMKVIKLDGSTAQDADAFMWPQDSSGSATAYICNNWANVPLAKNSQKTPQGTLILYPFGRNTTTGQVWCRQVFISAYDGRTYHRFADSKRIGEWVYEGEYCGENLLINPDFRINQSLVDTWHDTTLAHTTLICDGWRLYGGGSSSSSEGTVDATATITDSGLLVTNSSSKFSTAIYQVFPYANLSDFAFAGLENMDATVTYTLSVGYTTSANVQRTLSLTFTIDGSQTENCALCQPYTSSECQIRPWLRVAEKSINLECWVLPGNSITINYAKLELGAAATKFVHPNPQDELFKCQRHRQMLYKIPNGDKKSNFAIGCVTKVSSGTVSASFLVPLTRPLYKIPTLVMSNATDFAIGYHDASYQATSVSIRQVTNVYAMLLLTATTMPSTTAVGDLVTLALYNDTAGTAKIIFNADA